MTSTFMNLPWFARYHIYESLLVKNTTLYVYYGYHGKYITKSTSKNPAYHTLSQLNKTIAHETKLALFRVSSVRIRSLEDLQTVSYALGPNIGLVTSVVVELRHQYRNDALSYHARRFDAADIMYFDIKSTFPKLKHLVIDQDPGSDKLHSQFGFASLAMESDALTSMKYLSNGFGTQANLTNLTINAYASMGWKALKWLRTMIEGAELDELHIEVRVRFRCAADPRVQSEEIVGATNVDTGVMAVEHMGTKWYFLQTFLHHFLDGPRVSRNRQY